MLRDPKKWSSCGSWKFCQEKQSICSNLFQLGSFANLFWKGIQLLYKIRRLAGWYDNCNLAISSSHEVVTAACRWGGKTSLSKYSSFKKKTKVKEMRKTMMPGTDILPKTIYIYISVRFFQAATMSEFHSHPLRFRSNRSVFMPRWRKFFRHGAFGGHFCPRASGGALNTPTFFFWFSLAVGLFEAQKHDDFLNLALNSKDLPCWEF